MKLPCMNLQIECFEDQPFKLRAIKMISYKVFMIKEI